MNETTRENRKIHVEIVAAVYNRRVLTLQCLRSLSRINRENLHIHVIIVDDGSTDGTSEAIREQFPEVEILRGDGTWWFTGGSNRGIELALTKNPDYVLVINDDTIFDENSVRLMVECAERHERSVIGCLLLLWDEPHKVFQVAPKWNTWEGGWRHLHQQTVWTVPKTPFKVDFLAGNCILFPAQVFRENGLMNEKWLPHYGDMEFTPRIRKNGWTLLIEPRARVFNQPNSPPKKISSLPPKKIYEALWKNLTSPHNLRMRFVGYWIGAPTKLHAVAGFGCYVMRLAFKPLGVGKNWAQGYDKNEGKLKDFAKTIPV